MGIESIPVYIPDKWSAAWFRTFIAEVLAKLDTRNALGNGVTITSDGNSVATIDAQTDIDEAIATHDAAAAAHATQIAASITAHEAELDPHSQYATDTDLSDHVADTDPHPDLIADLSATNVSLDDEIMVLVNGTHRRATLGQLGAIVNGQSWKVPAKGTGTFTGHAPTI